ncbi:cyclase family protein [Erysipelothrix rhusiopathiae]|uniref:cyclase family protein n=1 Tax=Erysipelothrix rhusiopathiae TaxID=1648 RepID=UPI001EDF724D|nr:cyclase family protein [Erysipelothrix rhusiopathiae]MCG4456203.1 cyclase family protein [Erysipelothrix rhusiopathiae]
MNHSVLKDINVVNRTNRFLYYLRSIKPLRKVIYANVYENTEQKKKLGRIVTVFHYLKMIANQFIYLFLIFGILAQALPQVHVEFIWFLLVIIRACVNTISSDERFISNFPIDRFIGRGVMIDVRNQKEIDYKPDYELLVNQGDVVVFYTGFDERRGEKVYFEDHPVFTEELAMFLVEKQIKMVGMDIPSPDLEPYYVHNILMDADIMILENLNNLDSLRYHKDFIISAVPLKIEAEASPVRAYAVLK